MPELEVTECAQRAIAREARRTGTGARGLRSLLEKMLLEARYQAPEHASSEILLSGQGMALLLSCILSFLFDASALTTAPLGVQNIGVWSSYCH
ncbi:MAG: hypothetical protein HC767_14970 [Akkermansiaceae bacterium]|nr:hypothetical protein [Akkermansiaceae bacterium]